MSLLPGWVRVQYNSNDHLIKLKVRNDKICELAQADRLVKFFSSFLKQLQKNQLSRNTRTCNITQCEIGT